MSLKGSSGISSGVVGVDVVGMIGDPEADEAEVVDDILVSSPEVGHGILTGDSERGPAFNGLGAEDPAS